jgi:hypothetical protein
VGMYGWAIRPALAFAFAGCFVIDGMGHPTGEALGLVLYYGKDERAWIIFLKGAHVDGQGVTPAL